MWVDASDVPMTEDDIDKTICVEIPDQFKSPRLHKIVMSNMIHSPCGKDINRNSPCMDGDICPKSFPKPFAEAWFKLNSTHPPARSYFYREIPYHFWFDKTDRKWKLRKKRINVIGRIYSVTVKLVERHSLRLLLINVPGATSFENLRTVDGILHLTFKEAAIARNLLADDSVWERVMAEAIEFEMPVQLRQLFVNIGIHCSPTNTRVLLDNNLSYLMEDFTRRDHEDEIAKNLALK
ncbi:ATP-dependent Helicase-like protein [Daphnia magna]|uniref:ATP-dependent Helicase-like protein n=1 Tax=Daphnia magna TaxID=35525 RepID=A0A164KZG5_9CRUS|nr:ATP-dependent Helicase-like protein [Daphnia magna]